MSIIHVNHIQSNCRSRFSSTIDMSDVTTTDTGERDDKFLSRSLAAFAIAATAKVDDNIAAQSVVDEYRDDGIDAFLYDPNEHVAYLVQSSGQRTVTAQSTWVQPSNFNKGSITSLKIR